ncbi:LysR family transcriptional regulator [Thalassovita sp.]|uniref:LysR family transcriptional regulator n=1 Tax=Thalassovita sp. TaxID=1979401 RepID=UPI002881A825|nr:LysR family transcriptional regulator [Thalassovita sp.]MDF1802135.1 LysR family transcriptional regulator [Thalassovita sp.]
MLHINRTDLNLFIVFEAVYSQGGVTRAAETLNLSQPTISHALARLRERVGDPLFVRQGQKLAPTPMAERIIGPVRDALKIFERTLGELDGFSPESAEMHFNIGMRSLMESTYLLPLVLLLNENAPGVSVSACPFDRRRLEQSLASGELNSVIDVFLPVSADVQRMHLGAAPSVVVARRGHPLIDGQVDLETYLKAEHVLVTSRPHGLGPEDQALSRIGHSRNIRGRCQQINTAMRIVASSNMLLTMSETFAIRANTWFDNQVLPTPFAAETVDTYLYWHGNSDADPANQWFREMIKATVAETQPSP